MLVQMRSFSAVLVGLLLACPLLFSPGSGYDAVRLPAVLGLVCALFVTVFLASARGGERPPGPAPLRTAGLLLLGASLISLAAARSLADAATPILVLFAAVSVFSCLRGGILSRERAIRLLPVVSIMGLGVAGIGLLQFLGGAFKIDVIVQHLGGEPVATEGNRNYAGGLCAMLLPVTISLARTGPRWSRISSLASSAALAVLLLLSESRGGLIAVVAGLGIAGGAMAWRRVERGPAAAAIAVVLILAGFGMFQLRRQVSAERLETAGFRMDVWKSGARMMAARPVLGWGVGGFQTEYPPFRSESEFRFSHKNVTDAFKELEDAHSSWVQIAVETGVVGLLAFLLVTYVAARLWRYYVKVAPDPDRAAMLAGLGGGAAAYLVAGLFNTLTLKTSHTVLFWSFLGLIELIGEIRPWRGASRTREWRAGIPAGAAVVAFFGLLWAGRLGMADLAFTAGMQTRKASERESRLREALDGNPWAWRAHYELALTLATVERLQGALEEGRATLRLRPHHLDALNHTAICLLRTGGGEKEAEALFLRAVEVAPYYHKTLFNYGLFQRLRGNRAEARRLFSEAIDHHPASASSYLWRGIMAYAGGDVEMALGDFRKARELGADVGGALRSEKISPENDARLAEFFR
jgi:O-antigen ligase/Tfp pilus assembly protein PilF